MVMAVENIEKSGGEISAADMAAFSARWRRRALCVNFDQVWLDRDTGELVDFAQIADEGELQAASERAERQYLAIVEKNRRDYCGRFSGPTQRQALVQFERALCESDLYYLGKYKLGYEHAAFHLHYFMCRTVEGLPAGYRGLREFARDTFKTTFMGIANLVQMVLKDPDVRILYKSNAEDNAVNKIGEAKAHFLKNDRLRELYPEHVPQTKAQEGSGSKWTTPARRAVYQEATFTASGVGSSKVSQHYDFILADDFWDSKSVTNPEVMSKARAEMHQLEYLLAVPARGRILFIGTRFAHDDMTQDLLDNPEYHCVIVSGITVSGRSVFPENLPLRKFYGQANGSEGSLYVFSCQIMLNPTDEERGFERGWFRYLRWSDMREQEQRGEIRVRKVILTDAAADGKSTSDPVAVETWAIDSKKRVVLIDYCRKKMKPTEFMAEVERQYDKHLPEMVARQKTALETTIQAFWDERNRDRMKEGLRPIPFYDYSLRKRDKKERITASLQPLLQSGRMYFDPEVPHLAELEQELLDHPKSQNDDGADAASMLDDPVLVRIPQHTQPPPPPETDYRPDAAAARERENLWRKERAKKGFDRARANARVGRRHIGKVTA